VTLAVLDYNCVSITSLAPNVYNAPIAGCLDWSARWRSIVNAIVRADTIQNRVPAVWIETRADACKLNRRPDKGFSQAGAVGAIVTGIAVAVGVANGSKGFTAIGKTGSKDIIGAHCAVAHMQFFVHDFKGVALTNVTGEVHVVAEDVGHLHGQVM